MQQPKWRAAAWRLLALVLTPLSLSANPLVVRTNYSAMVLYYNPHILRGGERIRVKDAYGYRDIDQLCRDYAVFLRKASGGQVNFSVAFRHELDEFPPDTDPKVTFTADNYERYRAEGYDLFNHGKADYHAICRDPRFGIIPKVEAGLVDFVWIFSPDFAGFWEAAMAGRDAYWVNGDPYPDIECSRRFVLLGFGMAAHQGVGFMLENTAHMVENIMHERIAASAWPARHLVSGWNTLDASNPSRTRVDRRLNDWELFTSTDAVHWDTSLVVPGASHAGLSHFPPTACVNYGWSAPRYEFDVPWEAEGFRVLDGSWSMTGGNYIAAPGYATTFCYGSHDLRDARGEYRVPVILSDARIETAIQFRNDGTSGSAGMLLRARAYGPGTNALHGYYVGLNAAQKRLEIARLRNNFEVLASRTMPLHSGSNYPLFVTIRGKELRVALSQQGPATLVYPDLEWEDGSVGLANYGGGVAFSHLYLTPSITNHASAWRSYPGPSSEFQMLTPADWRGDDQPYSDMDYWYAWWYEHLPKNPGTHEVRGVLSGELLGRALNSWWPYLFDINVFDRPFLPAGAEVVSAPADKEAPASVTNLVALATPENTVRLAWPEPPDNIGVTRYELHRDGSLIHRTPLRAYEDREVLPQAEHRYWLRALDGSGNASPPSNTVTVRVRGT